MDLGSRKRMNHKGEECSTKKQKIKIFNQKKFSLDLQNVPPVPSLNAFERGYQIESILDIVEDPHKEKFLYVKFKNLPTPELVLVDVVLDKAPEMLTEFCKEYTQAYEKSNQAPKKAA